MMPHVKTLFVNAMDLRLLQAPKNEVVLGKKKTGTKLE